MRYCVCRQNSDHCGAMSNKNFSACARGDVCSFGAHLYFYNFLLLYEEMADTSQNDALNNEKDSFTERICKSKWEKTITKNARVHTYIHTHIHAYSCRKLSKDSYFALSFLLYVHFHYIYNG